jgi:hypothetical protein
MAPGNYGAAENMVRNFLEKLLDKPFQSNCRILDGKEIDLYNDELKLGVEYCGLYWHSELFRPEDYHYNKFLKCRSLGITLVTIFEDEWDNQEKLKKYFLSIVKLRNRRYQENQICDNRWPLDSIYKKNGLSIIDEIPPDFEYISLKGKKIRLPKEKFKSEPNKDEYSKIWDCGKTVWGKEKTRLIRPRSHNLYKQ